MVYNWGICNHVFDTWLEKNNHEVTHHPISCWYDELISDVNQTDMERNLDLLNDQDTSTQPSTQDVINLVLNMECATQDVINIEDTSTQDVINHVLNMEWDNGTSRQDVINLVLNKEDDVTEETLKRKSLSDDSKIPEKYPRMSVISRTSVIVANPNVPQPQLEFGNGI